MGLFKKNKQNIYVDMRGMVQDSEEKISTPDVEFDIAGYKMPGTMHVGNFGSALALLKQGAPIAREDWNGKNQYLELQVPDAHSKMSLPYIFITTVTGDRVPWLASQTDLLANDWFAIL